MSTIFTVGHSTHPAERFRDLLVSNGITAVADVRSSPYSRMNPQFNREKLRVDLKRAGASYVFLGQELGARSEDPTCYVEGKVQYDLLAQTKLFAQGLDRVCRGASKYRIALLCAEKDPLTCHRCILVSRYLIERKFDVQHILANGSLESHSDALTRLIRELRLGALFRSRDDLALEAYRCRGDEIAYVAKEPVERAPMGGAAR